MSAGGEQSYPSYSAATAAGKSAAGVSEEVAPTSLFHPLGTVEQLNTHTLSLIFVHHQHTAAHRHRSLAGVRCQRSQHCRHTHSARTHHGR